MKVHGYFLGPTDSTDKTTLIIKVKVQRSGVDTIKYHIPISHMHLFFVFFF